jgi:hypothetical protein
VDRSQNLLILAEETSTTMSYREGGSVPGTRVPTNSNPEGGLSSASTKSELSKLLVGARDLSVLFRFRFSCTVQPILRDRRVSASRYYLFRSSLLRIVKVIKRSGSFTSSLLAVLFCSVNIRRP